MINDYDYERRGRERTNEAETETEIGKDAGKMPNWEINRDRNGNQNRSNAVIKELLDRKLIINNTSV